MTHSLSIFIKRHFVFLLCCLMICYCVWACLLVFWKYFHFQYNALDLAIFSQVVYESSIGKWFAFSIHPSSYLGDHLELIIIPLSFVYKLIQSPLTLLVLQNIFIALCAWPLARIILFLTKSKEYAFITGVIWVLNPFAQNISTFEFHALPFAIFFFLWAFYFFVSRRFFYFSLFSLVALCVREDVALVIFMFGALALLEKRKIFWIIFPPVLSALYFFVAMRIIHSFNPDTAYKFSHYYAWIQGSSVSEKMLFLLSHPFDLLIHVVSAGNILFVIALFIPFAFLPIFRPKYLILAIGVLAQLLLSSFSGSSIILQSHYSSLLLAPFTISCVQGLYFIFSHEAPANALQRLIKRLSKFDALLLPILLASIFVYSSVTWGSFFLGPYTILKNRLALASEQSAKTPLLRSVPSEAKVAASFEFLPNLSSRDSLYSLHYAFIGQRQYSSASYELPSDVEYILMNSSDFFFYQWQFSKSPIYKKNYKSGSGRISQYIKDNNFVPSKIIDSFILWRKSGEAEFPLFASDYIAKPNFSQTQKLDDTLVFDGLEKMNYSFNATPDSQSILIPLSLYFHTTKKTDKNYNFILKFLGGKKALHQKKYAFAYGLYPTSYWEPDSLVQMNYVFSVPKRFYEASTSAQIIIFNSTDGYLTLNGYSTALEKSTDTIIGSPIEVPLK